MSTFRIFSHQARRIFAAGALLATTLVPALVPALVSAETVTTRSVGLSSSVKSATANYTVKFTGAAASTGAFIVEFCTDAAIGTACTPPTGIDTTNVDTSGTATVTPINTNKAVKVVLATPVTSGNEVSVELTDITNPSATGTFYARIVTYADSTAADTYTDADTLGTTQEDGAVALSITNGFGVNGAVLETLIFCAAKATDTIGTGCSGTLNDPDVTLGTGGILTTTPSEGTVKTQISTNAAHGAVVNLRNSTAGGGLKRAEAASSDITPFYNGGAAAADIGTGTAKFGLKLANLTGGTAVSGNYSAAGFFLDYAANNSTGVTSVYGSPVYNTAGVPINDGTADLVFAANISNITPAGKYSAALNLIATGTF